MQGALRRAPNQVFEVSLPSTVPALLVLGNRFPEFKSWMHTSFPRFLVTTRETFVTFENSSGGCVEGVRSHPLHSFVNVPCVLSRGRGFLAQAYFRRPFVRDIASLR